MWEVDRLPLAAGLIKRFGRLDVNYDDPRFESRIARTLPRNHAGTHEAGGSDVVELAQSQVSGLPAALAALELPAHTSAESGLILGVAVDGSLEWVPRGSGVGGGGALVQMFTGDFASELVPTFDGVFASDFRRYLVHVSLSVDTGTVPLRLVFRTAGVDDTAATYSTEQDTAAGWADWIADTEGRLATVGTEQGSVTFTVHNPMHAQHTQWLSDYTLTPASGTIETGHFAGTKRTTALYDGFSIYDDGSTNALTGQVEVYAYVPVQPPITGGTITSDATYWYHTFTTTDTLTVGDVNVTVDIVTVGGGGYGESATANSGGGAGGGGGEVIVTTGELLSASDVITLTIGGPSTDTTFGTLITARGGVDGSGATGAAGWGAYGDGGNGTPSSGGGAGQDGLTTWAGVFGGGGGGGSAYSAPGGAGGAGGGGLGGTDSYGGSLTLMHGAANTGGGGGGACGYFGGGDGGTGIIIIRYPR